MAEPSIDQRLEQVSRDLRDSPAIRFAQQAVDAISAWQAAFAPRALELQRQAAASPAAAALKQVAAWSAELQDQISTSPAVAMLDQVAATSAVLQRQISTAPAAAALSALARRTDETARAANHWLEDFNARYPNWPAYVAQVAENVRSMARRGLAPNWMHLDREELEATVLLMSSAEVNLAWAPNPAILRELIAADPAEVDGILAAHASDIIAELGDVLDDVHEPKLEAAARGARQALDANAAGLPVPAQAAAAVLVNVIVEDLHGLRSIRRAHSTYRRLDPEKADFDEFRRTAVRRCLSFACAGEDVPGTSFRRNRSAHHLDPEQYTPANAVRALLLVVGLLREEQFWIDEDALPQAA
jgi:hypothetical protein